MRHVEIKVVITDDENPSFHEETVFNESIEPGEELEFDGNSLQYWVDDINRVHEYPINNNGQI